jgi:hypothetical protein
MKAIRLGAGLLFGLALAGCGDSVPKEELDRARDAVQSGLTAWKQGEKIAKLKTASPPVEFTDDNWHPGQFKLLDFEIKKTEGKPGTPLRCTVFLSMQDRKGKKIEKDVVYEVRPGSPTVVARDPYY